MNYHKSSNLDSQIQGAKYYNYEKIEIVEIDGVKRVRRKKDNEVLPMSEGIRTARGFR